MSYKDKQLMPERKKVLWNHNSNQLPVKFGLLNPLLGAKIFSALLN